MDDTDVINHVVSKPKIVIIAGEKVTQSVGNGLISKLKPFTFAIKKGLQQRGINVTGLNFKTLVILYYNEYSGKEINVSEFINNVCFKLKPDDLPTGDINSARNKMSYGTIEDIVNTVVHIFKTSKDKFDTLMMQGFDAYNLMTDEQIIQAKAATIVENNLFRKFKGDHFIKEGDFFRYVKYILILVLFVYIVNEI